MVLETTKKAAFSRQYYTYLNKEWQNGNEF